MKRTLLPLLVCLLPSALFAAPPLPMPAFPAQTRPEQAGPYLNSEILAVQSELGSRKLGDFAISDFVALRERLSVARQKDEYVQSTGMHSLLLPGLGELQTGDTTNGMLFLGADLVTLAGTFTVAYVLLPSDLKFNHLDYFGSSCQTINDAWMGHSLPDLLPSFAAMLVGMTIDMTIRQWSSRVARRDATAAIDSGSVSFTPRIGLGFLGVDVAY